MTNKSLSQQICEACGIEEQKILVVGFDEYDITLPIFKTVKQTSDEPCIRVVREHCLPDFENNNNNFVKLLNIIYTCGINQKYDYQLATLSFEEDCYYYSEEYPNTFQHRYLEVLLYLLSKNYDSWDNKFQKIIKQAIREATWQV